MAVARDVEGAATGTAPTIRLPAAVFGSKTPTRLVRGGQPWQQAWFADGEYQTDDPRMIGWLLAVVRDERARSLYVKHLAPEYAGDETGGAPRGSGPRGARTEGGPGHAL